jgi:hypothetical protein
VGKIVELSLKMTQSGMRSLFYETGSIFQISLIRHLINKFKIFLIGLNGVKQYLNAISHIISFYGCFNF